MGLLHLLKLQADYCQQWVSVRSGTNITRLKVVSLAVEALVTLRTILSHKLTAEEVP